MKTLVIGKEDRYRKYMPEDIPFVNQTEMVFCERGSSDEALLEAAWDADFLAADPMTKVSGNVIRNMPNLKMIHSEGVGFNGFDLEAAAARGIPVCNCKGVNAGAVAEQTILLILALLRSAIVGDRVEREGGQIQRKERMMVEGIREVSDCTIGLIGFGDIAKATAERLYPFGCELVYTALHRKEAAVEERYHVQYLPLDELLRTCDIVSLHIPVTEQTRGMVNEAFLRGMKRDALLINTARGDLVDNLALRQALIDGTILGAGLDTIYPEPTTADNPLVDLPRECADRVVYSPHIGGITTSSFRRSHRMIWQGFADYCDGKRPRNIVNGV
ncbi:MAG: 2-hydroxyacid dehydrogenase [Eubacteriales bacterium]|nr:2-hydroxyacid dehydrogenase [Eubacteriales bacterium]